MLKAPSSRGEWLGHAVGTRAGWGRLVLAEQMCPGEQGDMLGGSDEAQAWRGQQSSRGWGAGSEVTCRLGGQTACDVATRQGPACGLPQGPQRGQ